MSRVRQLYGELGFKDRASQSLRKLNRSMDRSKQSMQSMSKTMGRTQKIQQRMTSSTKGLGTALRGIAGLAVVGVMKAFAGASLDAYRNLEKQRVMAENMAGKTYPALQAAIKKTVKESGGITAEGEMLEAANMAMKYGMNLDFLTSQMSSMQKVAMISGGSVNEMMKNISYAVNMGRYSQLGRGTSRIFAPYMDKLKALGSDVTEEAKQQRRAIIMQALGDTGKIQEQYNRYMQTGAAIQKKYNEATGNFKEQLGGVLAKGFYPMQKAIIPIIDYFNDAEKGTKRLKQAMLVITPIIGTLLVGALYSMAVAAWAAMTPFTPFIAVVFGIMAAIAALVLYWPKIKEFFQGIVDVVTRAFSWIRDKALAIWQGFVGKFLDAWESIKGIWDSVTAFFGGDKERTITVKRKSDEKMTRVAGRRAMGGQVNTGRPYLVGEKGPEIFSPNTSGEVTPNSRLGGLTTIQSIIGEMQVIVYGNEDAGQKVKEQVLDAMNELSRDIFPVESGMKV